MATSTGSLPVFHEKGTTEVHALHPRPSSELQQAKLPLLVRRLVQLAVSTAGILSLVILFHAVWNNTFPVKSFWSASWASSLATGTAVLFAALALIANIRRMAVPIMLFLLGAALVGRVYWLLEFDSIFASDFSNYWACGQGLAAEALGSGERNCRGVYLMRALLYTFPIHYFFGASVQALEVVNLLLIVGTTAVVIAIGTVFANLRVGLLAGILMQLWPDFWYSITVPSHDLSGALPLAGFFLCYLLGYTKILSGIAGEKNLHWPPIIALLLAASFCLALADITRSYGLLGQIMLLSAVPIALMRLLGRVQIRSALSFILLSARTGFLVFLLPLLFYMAVLKGFWSIVPYPQAVGGDTISTLSSMDVLGSNFYSQAAPWRYNYYRKLPAELKTEMGLRKIASEMTSSKEEYLEHLKRKNRVLSSSDSYLKWSTIGYGKDLPEWDINRHDSIFQSALTRLLIAAIFFFAALRILAGFFAGLPAFWDPLLAFSFSAYMIMLLFGESQGRYDIFLAPALCLLAASALVRKGVVQTPEPRQRSRFQASFLVSGVFGTALLVGCYFGFVELVHHKNLGLFEIGQFVPVPEQEVSIRSKHYAAPRIVRNTFKQINIAYPSDTTIKRGTVTGVRQEIILPPGESQLSFFIVSQYDRKNRPPWDEADAVLSVLIDGKRMIRQELVDLNATQFVQIPTEDFAGKDQPVTIEVYVKNRKQFISDSSKWRYGVTGIEFIALLS